MYFWRGSLVVFGILLVIACSHPLEIRGEGDILSASGTRDCSLEDFQAGAESCSKNLVVGEYQETYYAEPREGWEFENWLNYCVDVDSNECAFNVPADAVKKNWGATMPRLVAVFTKTAPPANMPVYRGSKEPAALTQQNARQLLAEMYRILDSGITLGIPPLSLHHNPILLAKEFYQDLPTRPQCDPQIDDQRLPGDGSGSLFVRFIDCPADAALTGEIHYYYHPPTTEAYKVTTTLDATLFTSTGDKERQQGRIELRSGQYQEWYELKADLIVTQQTSGHVYHSPDFLLRVEGYDTLLSARLYDAIHGYVNVAAHYSWPPYSGDQPTALPVELYLHGENDSQLRMEYHLAEYSYLAELEQLSLHLITAEPLADRLSIHIPPQDFLHFPYPVNEPPTVTLPESLTVDRLATLTLAFSGDDDNHDFLRYDWQLLATPPACNFSNESLAFDKITFRSECQGSFRVRLSANDGWLTSDPVEAVIDVKPLPAEPEPIAAIRLGPGDALNEQVLVRNTIADGPFSFDLAYGPNGVNIDSSGRLSGRPLALLSRSEQQFALGVVISNGRDVMLPIAVSYGQAHSSPEVFISPTICHWVDRFLGDIDGDALPDALCRFENSYRLTTVSKEGIALSYAETHPPSLTRLHDLTDIDIDGDGRHEIVLGYSDAIYVIDGQNKQVLEKIALPFTQQNEPNVDYSITPFTGKSATVILTGRFIDTYVLNLETARFEAAITHDSWLLDVGDLDGDGNAELVLLDGTVIDTTTGVELGRYQGIAQVRDVDADGLDDLVTTLSWLDDDADSGQLAFTVYYGGQLQNPRSHQLAAPDEFYAAESTQLVFLNVDDEERPELMLNNQFQQSLPLYHSRQDSYQPLLALSLAGPSDEPTLPRPLSYTANTLMLSDGQRFFVFGHSQPLEEMPLEHTLFYNSPDTELYLEQDYSLTLLGRDWRFEPAQVKLDRNAKVTDNTAPALKDASTRHLFRANLDSDSQQEYLFHQFEQQRYVVQDAATELIEYDLTWTNELTFQQIFAGPINASGYRDVIGIDGTDHSIVWLDLMQQQKLTTANATIDEFDHLIVDRLGDGNEELASLTYDRDSRHVVVRLLQRQGDAIVRLLNADVEATDQTLRSAFGLQDIDNDGRLEIIVSHYLDPSLYPQAHSTLLFYDDDLSYLGSTAVAATLTHIPPLGSGFRKRNLFAFGPANELTAIDINTEKAFHKLMEIDIRHGQLIWESAPFIGTPQKNSVHVLGPSPFSDRKALFFKDALYLSD